MHIETLLQKQLDEQKITNELLTQLVSGSVPASAPRIPQTPAELERITASEVIAVGMGFPNERPPQTTEAAVALDVPAPPVPVPEEPLPQGTGVTQETPQPTTTYEQEAGRVKRDIKTTSALISLREKLMYAQNEMGNPMLGLGYLANVGAKSYEQLTEPQIAVVMTQVEIDVTEFRANGGGVV